MLGVIGREGRDGPIIVFRLEDETLLWKVASNRVPAKDELVGPLVDGNVVTWYKVEGHRNEVWYSSSIIDDGELYTAEHGRLLTCVLVSEL